MSKLEETLKERGGQHGKFHDNAELTERLLGVCRDGKNYHTLSPVMKTAMFFVMHKAARILCGDPLHVDHWHDIGGYAKLAEDEATSKPKVGVHKQQLARELCPNCHQFIPLTVPNGKCPICDFNLIQS